MYDLFIKEMYTHDGEEFTHLYEDCKYFMFK